MNEREALKRALEALNKLTDVFLDTEGNHGDYEQKAINQGNKAITAIKEALANDALERKAENARELGLDYEPEQEQELVAFSCLRCVTPKKCAIHGCSPNTWPSEDPPQRKPLSNEEIYKIYRDCGDLNVKINIARAIEAAHGIKGEA